MSEGDDHVPLGLDKDAFDRRYGQRPPPGRRGCRGRLQETCGRYTCRGVLQGAGRTLYGLVPIVETLRTYRWRQWVLQDLMAGVSVGMVHIPQGMGFALLASVAPVYGLYASFWQVLFYMLLGHCRHLSIGTMAVISLMISPVVERETAAWRAQQGAALGNATTPFTALSTTTTLPSTTSLDPSSLSTLLASSTPAPAVEEGLTAEDRFRSSVAAGVSLVVGGTMLAMGVLRLGVLTTFMPPSFISGFTTAASLHITTTQLKGFFNVKVKRHGGMFNLPLSLYEIFKALPTTSVPDLTISLICMTFLIFAKEFINLRYKAKMKMPVPADMIVVVLGTLISYLAKLSARYGVKVIGFIPVGIPAPQVPNLDHAGSYIVEGMVTGVTSFAISIAMVDLLTTKHKYQAGSNQELVAYGLTYGLSAFFHCFAGAAAPPRCFVMEMTGGKTQVASVFTSLLLLLVLLVIGPVFRFLPNACLSCIIIVALFPLYKQVKILPELWRVSKPDLVIWVVTFLVSVIVDVSVSLGAGIVVAVLVSVLPALCAHGYVYGTAPDRPDLRAPTKTHSGVATRGDVVVFRYECTLYYLTIKNFKQQLFKATADPRTLGPAPAAGGAETGTVKERLAENGGADENSPSTDQKTTDGALQLTPGHAPTGLTTGETQTDAHSDGEGSSSSSDPALRPPPSACRLRAIILDCSPVGYVDLMGVNTLRALGGEYRAAGVELVLADCNPALLDKLRAARLLGGQGAQGEQEAQGEQLTLRLFPSVQDALSALTTPSGPDLSPPGTTVVNLNGQVRTETKF